MTKTAALYKFFSGFGIPAYPTSTEPKGTQLPYLTYTPVTGNWNDQPVGITVNLWYYTKREDIPDAKAEEISQALGLGGIILPCDGGGIWLTRGEPWCQSLNDNTDNNVKRRYINVSAEFLTTN